MTKVRLTDGLGFVVGDPVIPDPLPRVIVWGDDFYLVNEDDAKADTESPRYRLTTGFVITDTKESGSGTFKIP